MFTVKGLVFFRCVTTSSEMGGVDGGVSSGVGAEAAHGMEFSGVMAGAAQGMDALGVVGVGGGVGSDVWSLEVWL